VVAVLKQDTKKPYPAATERPKLYCRAPPPLDMEGVHFVDYDFVHIFPLCFFVCKITCFYYIPLLKKWEEEKLDFAKF
jgi:hypothetical protein